MRERTGFRYVYEEGYEGDPLHTIRRVYIRVEGCLRWE